MSRSAMDLTVSDTGKPDSGPDVQCDVEATAQRNAGPDGAMPIVVSDDVALDGASDTVTDVDLAAQPDIGFDALTGSSGQCNGDAECKTLKPVCSARAVLKSA